DVLAGLQPERRDDVVDLQAGDAFGALEARRPVVGRTARQLARGDHAGGERRERERCGRDNPSGSSRHVPHLTAKNREKGLTIAPRAVDAREPFCCNPTLMTFIRGAGAALAVGLLAAGVAVLAAARWTRPVAEADAAAARGDWDRARASYAAAAARF